jgi:sterol desaturase/sphingolipid hydroxylase (fatty acid hydroxylase superfamily)
MSYAIAFLTWTFSLYWIHRIGHKISFINFAHRDHHRFININGKTNWHWNNLFLFNDTWTSTLDLWITEVVPTVLFSIITGHWWISIFYYLWAALIQEMVEHNPKFNLYPLLTSGKWHLIHHQNPGRNFGLFLPIWDKLFGTHQDVRK